MSPWQVIFVTGIAVGWHRQSIERWLARAPRGFSSVGLALAVVAVPVLYVAQVTELEFLEGNRLLQTFAFDKPDLVIGRLVVLVLLAVVSFAVATALWVPINSALGWLLLPLGQHALAAYSLHIFVVAGMAKVTTIVLAQVSNGALATTVLQLAGVSIVWIAVRSEPAIHDALTPVVRRVSWSPLATADALRDEMAGPGA